MQKQTLLLLLMLPAAAAGTCTAQEIADAKKTVIFEQVDAELGVRTMVVTQDGSESDHGGVQRSLVLTDAKDTSYPCTLDWWLQHNPQGLGVCTNKSSSMGGQSCGGQPCDSMPDDIWNGYVRTMLAVAVFTPPVGQGSSFLQLGAHKAARQLSSDPAAWSPRATPARLAVVGLGASTMANWIRHHLPDTRLDIAEIVPGVAAAAPCFGLDTSSDKLQIHVGDGRKFLESAEDNAFDAILIDAFDPKESLPSCFKSQQFFETVHRKVVPGGAVAFNLLDFPKDSPRVLASLRSVFGGDAPLYTGDAPGAQGIQEVVVAFRPSQGGASTAGGKSIAADAAASYLEQARFRPLGARGEKATPLDDSEVCPQAAPSQPKKDTA